MGPGAAWVKNGETEEEAEKSRTLPRGKGQALASRELFCGNIPNWSERKQTFSSFPCNARSPRPSAGCLWGSALHFVP